MAELTPQQARLEALRNFKLSEEIQKAGVVHAKPEVIKFFYHGKSYDLRTIEPHQAIRLAKDEKCSVLRLKETSAGTGTATAKEPEKPKK